MCYSRWEDGAYCLPCVLFGDKYPSSSKLQNFFSRPFRYWADALRNFRKHENKSGLHTFSFLAYTKFLQDYHGKSMPINKLLDSTYKAEVKKNREALLPIVDTVKLCGRQNLSLRGHRDNVKDQPKVGTSGINNPGNFIELLNFRVRGGDDILKNHLLNSALNAKFTSAEIQNEIINCFGSLITEKLIDEVKDSKYYSILGDEATDCALTEQLALILRFVDSKKNIREEFVAFLSCNYGLTGEGLFQTIKEYLGKVWSGHCKL